MKEWAATRVAVPYERQPYGNRRAPRSKTVDAWASEPDQSEPRQEPEPTQAVQPVRKYEPEKDPWRQAAPET